MTGAVGCRGSRQEESTLPARCPVRLDALAARLEGVVGPLVVEGRRETLVGSVELDHRRVAAKAAAGPAGPLYCCLVGEHRDGHDLAPEAARAGAAAFLCERSLGQAAAGLPQLIVGRSKARAAMAEAACAVAGDPAAGLTTLGVTGTNGKTTTTHLLWSILAEAGYAATVIGTLSGARTTPEAPELQERLALAVEQAKAAGRPPAVALEVTSHSLVQHRVDGYLHDVAVFTNLSRDHLDYHKTMEAYFAAKASLFTPSHAKVGVVNRDDPYGRRLLESPAVPTESFSIAEAEDLVFSAGGSRFRLAGHEVELGLLGRFNVENALAAAAAARLVGISGAKIAAGLSKARPVRGRFEQVENPLGLQVVVDYAHTPAGLEQACATLRPLLARPGRLLVVFGAGGERDTEKRPLMGRAVVAGADVAVVTSDNPRHEPPGEIIGEILAGCEGAAELHVEEDRRKAIALALRLAAPGDIVLVAGKGHETTQQIGEALFSFDDRQVVLEESSRLAGTA